MKKTLLSIAAAVLAACPAFAQIEALPFEGHTIATEDSYGTRAADGYDINFAGSVYTWYSLSKSTATYRGYIYIPADIATKLAGNTVESISVCCYISSAKTLPGSVFVAEDEVTNVVTSTETQMEMLSKASSSGVTPVFQEVALDTPYVIKENQGFYLGYTIEKCVYEKDYPVPVDEGPANPFAGYVDIIVGSNSDTVNMATDAGANLCIKAKTKGDVTGISDFCLVSDMSLGFTLPIVEAGESSDILVTLNNIGSNEIKSLDYTIEVAGVETSGTADVSVKAGKSKTVTIPSPAFAPGRNTAKVSLTKINEAPANISGEVEYIAVEPDMMVDRRFVVEEGTGTWCGYCPAGIVGMDYMQEKYPETFVGIAVHSQDSFSVASYNPLLNLFQGVPSCIINRDPLYIVYPSDTDLKNNYNTWKNQRGAVDVNIDANLTEDGKKVDATATVVFGFSDSRDYRVAFVVTEDGLTGTQTNYYAGTGSKGPGDWGNKGSAVKWTYTHTARAIYDFKGIEGSLPANIEKGVEYTYNYQIPKGSIKNFDNISVIALVLDAETGTIMNAAKMPRLDASAIKTITDDASVNVFSGRGFINVEGADAAIYSLDGRKVAAGSGSMNLNSGMYIVVANGKSYKVVVR